MISLILATKDFYQFLTAYGSPDIAQNDIAPPPNPPKTNITAKFQLPRVQPGQILEAKAIALRSKIK